MAKHQTRRAISVSRELYTRLAMYCETNNTTISGFVESTMRSRVDLPPSKVSRRPRQITLGPEDELKQASSDALARLYDASLENDANTNMHIIRTAQLMLSRAGARLKFTPQGR